MTNGPFTAKLFYLSSSFNISFNVNTSSAKCKVFHLKTACLILENEIHKDWNNVMYEAQKHIYSSYIYIYIKAFENAKY